MRRALACLPLALLLIANVVPSKAQKSAEEVVSVREGAPLELACALRVEQRAEWRRDGGALPAELRPAGEAPAPAPRGGLLARLRAPHARLHHAGVYTCARGPDAQRLRLVVQPTADADAAPGAETTPAAAGAGAGAGAGDGAGAAMPLPADGPEGTLQYYDMLRNTSLRCTLDNPSKLPYVWEKNGTEISAIGELTGRYKLSEDGALLALPRALEDDWGNYSCAVGGGGERQAWRLHARVYTRLPAANTNVVEGQKLKLTCKVIGRPAPAVEWRYNASGAADAAPGEEAAAALGAERVTLRDSEAGVAGGELLLDAARRSDAGRYSCVPLAPADALAALPFGHTTLRVKDMYAALWPFLGICAEVLVLCAVILVYEKRRTKPELDDSDTDNHDQKKS